MATHPGKESSTKLPARQAHQQGTVTLYAVVGADGQMEKTQLLETGGQWLDQATLDAVQQWIYPPLTCGTQPHKR